MTDPASKPNVGTVVAVRASVVEVRFDQHLPSIYTVLRAGDGGHIVIEVLAQHDAHHVRGIALTLTQRLAFGMAVQDTGGPLKVPVSGLMGQMPSRLGYQPTMGTELSGPTPMKASGRARRDRRARARRRSASIPK